MIGARVGRQCRAGDYRHQQCVRSAGMSLVVLIMIVVGAIPAGADPSPDLRRELELLKAQMERSRTQMEQDRQRIEQLERQLQSVEAKGEQKSKEMEEQIAGRLLNRSTFGEYIDRFAGEHRFQLTGYGTAAFEWQERTNRWCYPSNALVRSVLLLAIIKTSEARVSTMTTREACSQCGSRWDKSNG